MVQPGEDWDGDNDTGPLDRPTRGRILSQRQVRARLIVIRRIRSKNSPQVLLTEDLHPVQALAAHGADQAFCMTILPRRSRRGRSVADLNRAKTELRPGTLLTSECDGHLQRVMELPDGFTWNGKTDRSLSKVAFAITGSHWNGPRFFSLREAVVGGSAVKNAATTGGFRKPIYSVASIRATSAADP